MPVRSVPTPTIAQLAPLLAALGKAPPVVVTKDVGKVFRLDLADGTALILKAYDDVILRHYAVAGELFAARLLAGLDVPVTRYLMQDDSRRRLPFAFAVTNYLPGLPVSSFADPTEAAELHRQMGTLLRTLHTVRLPAFGHFAEAGVRDPVATNVDYMRKAASHAFGQFRDYGADPALASVLETIVAANADLFAHSHGLVFAHDDLYPNNVLAERGSDGRVHISGLIDLGNCRAADPLFDLAKTLLICEHDAPGSTSAIRAGYGALDHPEPEAALWLYTLVHRVVMWWWLRRVGVIMKDQPSGLMSDLTAMAAGGKPPGR